jgi:hypothetical protein
VIGTLVDAESWDTAHNELPVELAHVMPTRLGNALRRSEMIVGAACALPVLRISTHIGMVANPAHTAYVSDQRTRLDLAVRTSVLSLAAAVLTGIVLWPYGVWLVWALVPYVVAWLTYRGAVVAARSYGAALAAWVDLNRFELYAALHMPLPATADVERTQNAALTDLLIGSKAYQSTYEHAMRQQESS